MIQGGKKEIDSEKFDKTRKERRKQKELHTALICVTGLRSDVKITGRVCKIVQLTKYNENIYIVIALLVKR